MRNRLGVPASPSRARPSGGARKRSPAKPSPANAAEELRRAIGTCLQQSWGGRDVSYSFENFNSRPWASITFRGERHSFVLAISGPDAERTADDIAVSFQNWLIDIQGHILADFALTTRGRVRQEPRLCFDALTVEAGQ